MPHAYSEEFKKNIVEESQGKVCKQFAKEKKISLTSLKRWKGKYGKCKVTKDNAEKHYLSSQSSEDDAEQQDAKEWSKENLHELISRMLAKIGPSDHLQYISGLEKLSWDQVAFDHFTAKDCKHKWRLLSEKVRKFRTLTDLVLDVQYDLLEQCEEGHQEEAGEGSDRLKQPLPPPVQYYLEKLVAYSALYPNLTKPQVFTRLHKKYEKLPQSAKEKYIQVWEKKNEEFYSTLKKIEDQNSPSVEVTSVPTSTHPLQDKTIPSSFSLSKMDPKDRQKFLKKRRNRYVTRQIPSKKQPEVQKKSDKSLVKSTNNVMKNTTSVETNQKSSDRNTGKVKKVPINGYNLFCMETFPTLKDMPNQACHVECARLWKLATEEKKQDYHQRYLALKEEHKRNHMKTSSPKQTDKSTDLNGSKQTFSTVLSLEPTMKQNDMDESSEHESSDDDPDASDDKPDAIDEDWDASDEDSDASDEDSDASDEDSDASDSSSNSSDKENEEGRDTSGEEGNDKDETNEKKDFECQIESPEHHEEETTSFPDNQLEPKAHGQVDVEKDELCQGKVLPIENGKHDYKGSSLSLSTSKKLADHDNTQPHDDEDTHPHDDEDTRPHDDEDTQPHDDEDTQPHDDETTQPHDDETTHPHDDEDTHPLNNGCMHSSDDQERRKRKRDSADEMHSHHSSGSVNQSKRRRFLLSTKGTKKPSKSQPSHPFNADEATNSLEYVSEEDLTYETKESRRSDSEASILSSSEDESDSEKGSDGSSGSFLGSSDDSSWSPSE